MMNLEGYCANRSKSEEDKCYILSLIVKPKNKGMNTAIQKKTQRRNYWLPCNSTAREKGGTRKGQGIRRYKLLHIKNYKDILYSTGNIIIILNLNEVSSIKI